MFILNVGLPGSGKSTLIRQLHLPDSQFAVINPDSLRFELFGVTFDISVEAEVWTIVKALVKGHFRLQHSVYLDATNLTKERRRRWIHLAKKYEQKVYAVYFDMPIEQIINQNNQRPVQWVVPQDVIEQMHKMMERPQLEEGFESVITIKDIHDADGIECLKAIIRDSLNIVPMQ